MRSAKTARMKTGSEKTTANCGRKVYFQVQKKTTQVFLGKRVDAEASTSDINKEEKRCEEISNSMPPASSSSSESVLQSSSLSSRSRLSSS